MSKTKNRKSTSKGRPRNPTRRDDIPRRANHTYRTESCVLPRVTDTCTVRTLGHDTITSTAVSATTSQLIFSLSRSGLGSGQWDQYRIDAVRVTIAPDNPAIGLLTNSTTTFSPLYCVIDYDDATALGSVAAAEAYSNCIVLNAGESCERLFRPRMAVAAYSGAFTSYANVEPQWIDAGSTTVQHYGVKIYVPGVTTGQTLLPSWQISTEYFITFRKSI